eukprot:evm.model.scf_536.2 EVM.evm.TU.scf_536.2   scf_536:20506-30592(+)
MPSLRKLLQGGADAGNEDACEGNSCSGHGKCRKGSCKCDKGFEGPDCQLDVREQSTCPTGVLDVEGNCCDNGVYDHLTGECCPGEGAILDKDGLCCNGSLDVCGVCNGKAIFIDALGRCCDTTLDSAGLCCPSGDVDVCGVCDGFGASCATQLVAMVQGGTKDADSVEQCIAQDIATMLELEEGTDPAVDIVWTDGLRDSLDVAFNISGIPRSKLRPLERLVSSQANLTTSGATCSITDLLSFARLPVCGNGVCEVGEAAGSDGSGSRKGYSCPEDCPVSFDYDCPTTSGYGTVGRKGEMCSGHGRCLYAEVGRCDCYSGYEGEACDRCALGLMPFKGKCVLRTGGAKQPGAPSFCCAPGQAANDTTDAVNGRDGRAVAPGTAGANSTASSSFAAVDAENPGDDASGTNSQFMGVSEAAFSSIMGVAIVAFIVCIALALLSYKRRRAKVPMSFTISDVHTTGDSGPLSNRDKTYSTIWHEFQQGLTKADGGARSLPMIMSSFDPGKRGDAISVRSPPAKQYPQGGSTARSTPREISADWVSDSSDTRERTRPRISSRSTASTASSKTSSSSGSSAGKEFAVQRSADSEEIRSQISQSSSERGVSIGNLLQAKQQALGESPSINVYDRKTAFNPKDIIEGPGGFMGAGRQQQVRSEYESEGASVRSGQMNMGHVGNKWRRTERPSVGASAPSSLAWGGLGAEITAQSTGGNNSTGVSDGSTWEIEPASQSSEKDTGHVMVSNPWTFTAARNSEDDTAGQHRPGTKLRMPPPAGMPVDAIYNVRTEVPAEGSGLVAVGFQLPIAAKSPNGSSGEDTESPLFAGRQGCGGLTGQPSMEQMGGMGTGILRPMQVEEATASEPEARGTRHVGSGGNVRFPQVVTIRTKEVDMGLSDWEREMSAQNGAPAVKVADVWESCSHASLSYGEQEFKHGSDNPSHPLQEINPTWSALTSHLPDESRPEGEAVPARHQDHVGGPGLEGEDSLEFPAHRQLDVPTVYASDHVRLSEMSESASLSSRSWDNSSGSDRNLLRLEDVPKVASPTSHSWDEQPLDDTSTGFGARPAMATDALQNSWAYLSLEPRQPETMRVHVTHANGLAHFRRSSGSFEEPHSEDIFVTCPEIMGSNGSVIDREASDLEG